MIKRKLMRLNELHKFSDGTLTRVMEKLDQMVKDFHLYEYNKGMETRKWSEDDKRRSKDFITAIWNDYRFKKDILKDGDGDGIFPTYKGVKASANSDVMYSFTSAQDGDPLQDDVRLCLGDDLKKAQDHSQRQAIYHKGHPQKEDQCYVNSGCSRHMTGNMSYLSDFKEFDRGYVTFGGGAKGGKITGKRTLKTANESQVLLKVPRKNNMYSVDMKNIVPKESLSCLVAKATLDESMLWHRRLGHVKFKTIIKLVKENLVRGLPTKRFENDQTCVACLKGKQHKASYYLGNIDGKSDEGFFVGYSMNSKAFRVYNIRTRKVKENLHIRFLEDKPIITGDGPKCLFDIDVLTKSMNYVPVVAVTNSNDFIEPKKIIQALKDLSRIEAMQEELLQFKLQQVWTLVDLLYGKRAIGTKWVYRNKKDEERIEALEEVYVCQPPGFEDPEFPDKVYKVEKALYGLHQAPRACQDKYVDEILKKFGFSTVKTASTPMETSKPLLKDAEAEDVDVHLYRSMIGSLMYLTASRPDIMFVVCACARFQVTPKVSHLHAVKRIFRYLKGQPKLGLWYPKDSPFDLEAYTDSDYAGASLDRKSTTGGCQFLGRRLISWQCKKQTIVANSTTEAEYVAAASCCGQVLWIQNQMLDYGYNFMNTKIHIDNESTICIVKKSVFHSRLRTLRLDILH
ncbi:putative ribonuclease H-like domain-containing protein [Tanacetum coccineum]